MLSAGKGLEVLAGGTNDASSKGTYKAIENAAIS
jgi:hypothetical protein